MGHMKGSIENKKSPEHLFGLEYKNIWTWLSIENKKSPEHLFGLEYKNIWSWLPNTASSL